MSLGSTSSKPQLYHTPGWPADKNSSPQSSTSTFHSASLSSSTMSDNLPADSSQSDIASFDHNAMSKPARGLNLPHGPQPRSSSLPTAMGQASAKPSLPPEHVSTSGGGHLPSHLGHKGLAVAAATGHKLKRAFAGRRKKSVDSTQLFSSFNSGHESGGVDSDSPVESSSPATSRSPGEANTHRPSNESASQALMGIRRPSLPGLTRVPSPTPPPPPPKPLKVQPVEEPPVIEPTSAESSRSDHRGSIIPLSPGISSAVNYMCLDDEPKSQEEKGEPSGPVVRKRSFSDKPPTEEKEIWRKSDSTVSHHTIRPGGPVSNRSSRPVSMAESLQSIHTIVPERERPVNKRLSALITDADFAMPEEEEKSIRDPPPKSSPPATLRARDRRSMSLTLGPTQTKISAPPTASASATVTDFKQPSRSFDHGHQLMSSPTSETPTLSRAAATGIISPSHSGSSHSVGTNMRGKLAAWATTGSTSSVGGSSVEDSKPRTPPPRHTPSPRPHGPVSFRSTAISMSNGFAPAAGLAKRAVEKMGRAWGGLGTGGSSSGYSSSSSSTGPSSYSDHALDRTSSNQSHSGKSKVHKNRRTPNAPSGSWSVNSSAGSASLSDTEALAVSSGPSLGIRVRGPLVAKSGAFAAGGVVFGRNLQTVVRETAVGVGVHGYEGRPSRPELKALESRMLPAIVARCAQHILLWGVQEEGLFRVTGRPSHVAKLRSEFDTGADYDMQDCSPGELDPHAVSSIFKAYLRELPEPILTHSLFPYFEEALAQEIKDRQSDPSTPDTQNRIGGRGPTLPTNPRSGLPIVRKAPSLSTLAMPNLSGMKPPSQSLINVLSVLVAQLPAENRDLLRTVTELIKATAKDQKTTKMPLSNLLLVFCPSLNMNPPTLRALCEAGEIWDAAPPTEQIIDIKRDDSVIDIRPLPGVTESSSSDEDSESESESDGEMTPAKQQEKEAQPGLETQKGQASASPISPSSPASAGGSTDSHRRAIPRVKPLGPRRAISPTSLKDMWTDSANISIDSSLPQVAISVPLPDDDSSSALSVSEARSEKSRLGASSPPALSSSAESLQTPSSFSNTPSFDNLPPAGDINAKEAPSGPPVIADSSDWSLPTSRMPHIITPGQGSIAFPSSGSLPATPSSTRRASMMIFGANEDGTNSVPSSPRKRMKRPSLQLLTFKRSASSLSSGGKRPVISGPYLQTAENPTGLPSSEYSSSGSVADTRTPSTYVLNTAIDSSTLEFDFEKSSPRKAKTPTSATDADRSEPVESKSPTSAAESSETPIARRYRQASMNLLGDNDVAAQLRPYPMSRNRSSSGASFLSTASSNHLGMFDSEEEHEDWTKSVLMAADVDGGWPHS